MRKVITAGRERKQADSLGWRALLLGLAVASLMLAQACSAIGASTVDAAAAKRSKPITVTAHLGSATQGTKFSGAISATGFRMKP